MGIKFTKYHGTGNDFIMIDDRLESFDISNVELISAMCNRRFGIGADGLILIRNKEGFDFEMVYFNADGRQSSMCGNGGRCIVNFAHSLGVFVNTCEFLAIDGPHKAEVLENGHVKLKMSDVDNIRKVEDAHVLDTGSPHYVKEVETPFAMDVKSEGAAIRYSNAFKNKGINVNFIQYQKGNLQVVTYERGVEDETFSCGTGVTACALVSNFIYSRSAGSPISITTKGGELKVYFEENGADGYENIWLQGPAMFVFEGNW